MERAELEDLLAALSSDARRTLSELLRPATEPIAVIGVGCRFPGGVVDLDSYWELLRGGRDAISLVPPERWDVGSLYDPDPSVAGRVSTRWGGFLDHIDEFDAGFFNISPREAAQMDPQQRLLLEIAWETLEDADVTPERIAGSRTGVFVGLANCDYSRIHSRDPVAVDIYSGTGQADSVAAGRISYQLDLQGPSVALDTACSSSLAAIHYACVSLASRESDQALAGGVNLILAPDGTLAASRMQMMAADGRCKVFDARADGFVRSEGCGLVLLKRLTDATAADDRILGVIRGSAANQDGRTASLTAPSPAAQESVIRQALANAGVHPSQIGYVEAHGTGTALGDPIEMRALTRALGSPVSSEHVTQVGSAKSNLGHMEAAAGVGGFLKALLCLRHAEVPPVLHFQNLNPEIDLDHTQLSVPAENSPFPTPPPAPDGTGSGTRYAGVSAFGWGGTNAHVILEEPPREPEPATRNAPPDRVSLLAVSARTPESLCAMARSYADLLHSGESKAGVALDALCAAASRRRSHHAHRLAVAEHSAADTAEALRGFAEGESPRHLRTGHCPRPRPRRITFVFPGQGSQWVGMGRGLMDREPVVRRALEDCDDALRPFTGWSLIEELRAGASASRLDEVDRVQPAIFAMQVALCAWWRSRGVLPDAVVGHSLGEIAAAFVSGALDLDDAAKVIAIRSQLVKRVPGNGAMAVVALPFEEASRAIAGQEKYVSVAARNSPTDSILSGEPGALEGVLAELEEREVFWRWIKVNYASHSPQMDGLLPEIRERLADLSPRAPQIPFHSTVAKHLDEMPVLGADYWAQNLREPVRFWDAVMGLAERGHDCFLEMSPHPVLISALREGFHRADRDDIALLGSLRRDTDEERELLLGLGTLHTLGHPVDWEKLYPRVDRTIPLPRYAWSRQRYWLPDADGESAGTRRRVHGASGEPGEWANPLLARHLSTAAPETHHYFETDLGMGPFRYLADHRVDGATPLPGAAFVEMILAAAAEIFGDGPHRLCDLQFKAALLLPEKSTVQTLLELAPEGQDRFGVEISSRAPSGGWTRHLQGTLHRADPDSRAPERVELDALRARLDRGRDQDELYAILATRSLEYGPAFRGVLHLHSGGREALGEVRAPESIEWQVGDYLVHPALLDATFQVIAGLQEDDGDDTPFVLYAVDEVVVHTRPGTHFFVHATERNNADGDGDLIADLLLLDEAGTPLVELQGLRMRKMEAERPLALEDTLFTAEWIRSEPLPAAPEASRRFAVLLDEAGIGAALCSKLKERGHRCIEVQRGSGFARRGEDQYTIDPSQPSDCDALVAALGEDGCDAMLHLFGLDAVEPVDIDDPALIASQDLGVLSVLHCAKALALAQWTAPPRLWLVTAGAQPVGAAEAVRVSQSPIWGLARTIAQELPELRCTRVDLPGDGDAVDALLEEIVADGPEDQIALRPDARLVQRLRPRPQPGEDTVRVAVAELGDSFRFRLAVDRIGSLDSLELRAEPRRAPGADEVEIRVEAAALNFRDVLVSLGMVPGDAGDPPQLGGECSGTVCAVGPGVSDLQVGDAVVAVGPGSLASHVVAPRRFVARKPGSLSYEQAASLPMVCMTAQYALEQVGHMRAGESVLIHAAAGGVGLAAVQLAQRAGVEVFATAGSPEKRAYLRSRGVAHVMDSRRLDFAQEILEATGGRGVDLVLNSLSGDAIQKNLEVLAPYGRFLEIGVRDILENTRIGLRPFRKCLTYSAIELAVGHQERPEAEATLFHRVMESIERGELGPLPIRVFPVSAAEEAFRHMAQARHIGKVVLRFTDPHARVVPCDADAERLPEDATYVITGGLGGLGLCVARALVDSGARHLLLLGRRDPATGARTAIAELENLGAKVLTARVDVSDGARLAAVLEQARRELAPIRGVVHSAGLLDDAILLNQDRERWLRVATPKIAGAWNLHCLTREDDLDFFVLFSSLASLMGSPGQGNYAGANAFLDALAHRRRAEGLVAQSIHWGPWAEVGLAAQSEQRGKRLERDGLRSLDPAFGAHAFRALLGSDETEIAVADLDLPRWLSAHPETATLPLFSELVAQVEQPARATAEAPLRAELLALTPGKERHDCLEKYLGESIASVLGIERRSIDPTWPLADMGLESLTAVELKHRFEKSLGVTLSATLLFANPSIEALVPALARKAGIDLAPSKCPTQETKAGPRETGALGELVAEVSEVSDEDAMRLLANTEGAA